MTITTSSRRPASDPQPAGWSSKVQGPPIRHFRARIAAGETLHAPELARYEAANARTGAGFLSCVPGRLGLYVSEDGSNVFVLKRDP